MHLCLTLPFFSSFPQDKASQSLWVRNCRRMKFTPTKASFVCSRHFTAEDFEPTHEHSTRRRLKRNAVPTVFDLPPHLQPKKVCVRPPPKERSLPSSSAAGEQSAEDVEKNDKKDRLCEDDHQHYCLQPSHIVIRNREENLKKLESQKQKIRALQRKLFHRNRKIKTMEEMLHDLQTSGLVSSSCNEHLQTLVTPMQQMLDRVSSRDSPKTLQRTEYPPELKAFAITLQFYSTKAYEYVRETFMKTLPHVSTIRNWFNSIEGGPGFSNMALRILRNKAQEEKANGRSLLLAMSVDDMAIKQHIQYSEKEKKFKGFVDLGIGEATDSAPCATEAVVIMLVAINGHWKIPLGFFFIASLSGEERANLIQIALEKVHQTGGLTVSLTCDGPKCHFSMLQSLGAKMSPTACAPYFQHPCDPALRVYAFLDIVHMLKLVRNCLGHQEELISPSGKVRWAFIEKLHHVQEDEGLRAGTKLRKAHIQWEKMKMKVKLAAQTLSSSVAAAIDFLREDLKHPDFADSKATTEFIRVFDALFDTFNSRSPLSKGHKAPIRQDNEATWMSLTTEAMLYINSLKLKDGTPVLKSKLKTGFLGFNLGIVSLHGLYEDLVRGGLMNELLTYKLSQDHVELLFCSLRAGLGANNNPTVLQFEASFKRLLTHQQIKTSHGNASPQDDTSLLMGQSSLSPAMNDIMPSRRSLCSDMNSSSHSDSDTVEDFELDMYCHGVSKYKEAVVTYIAGYVVRMVEKKIHCEVCLDALTGSLEENVRSCLTLLNRKNVSRSLIIPSDDVVKVCLITENVLSARLHKGHNDVLQKQNVSLVIVNHVLQDIQNVA